jgi:hypothetical protein
MRNKLGAWDVATCAAAFLLTSVLIEWAQVSHRLDHHPRAPRVLVPDNLQLTSDQCRRCYEQIYAVWTGSGHAQAPRSVDVEADAGAFNPLRHLTVEGLDYEVSWHDGKPTFVEKRGGHLDSHYTADYVLGYRSLRQYIVPVGNGRYQATELAYDPARKGWFNVFGSEYR